MLICPYSCDTKLAKSNLKIYEPCSEPRNPEIIDFAIIPCLMADRAKNRLGYGKGFYDRFTTSLRGNCIKVTPVPSLLITETLPINAFDKPVDFVISENEIF